MVGIVRIDQILDNYAVYSWNAELMAFLSVNNKNKKKMYFYS